MTRVEDRSSPHKNRAGLVRNLARPALLVRRAGERVPNGAGIPAGSRRGSGARSSRGGTARDPSCRLRCSSARCCSCWWSELFNSAVGKATVDRISLDDHELAKKAKDLGSAAVFVSLVNCAVVWGLVLYDIFG